MKGSLIASTLTAVGATLCCTGPALLLLFGSTSIGMFSFLGPIRPFTSVLALSLLAFAFYKTYRRNQEKDCCEIDKEQAIKKQKTERRILWAIAPVVLALVLFPYYSGSLHSRDDNGNAKEKGAVVSEWTIEGMTCQGCAEGLQGGMAAVEGIIRCNVDYDSKTMVCAVRESIISTDAIPGLVSKMGYKAIPKESDSSREHPSVNPKNS